MATKITVSIEIIIKKNRKVISEIDSTNVIAKYESTNVTTIFAEIIATNQTNM